MSDVLIKFRRGVGSAWASADPILAEGEPGFETDTLALKIGDGSTSFNGLPYHHNPETVVNDAAAATLTLGSSNFNAITRVTDAGAVAVTVPTEAALGYAVPVGTMYKIRSAGAGGLTFVTIGLTVNGSMPTVFAQHDELWLRCVATDTYDVVFHHRESETP